MTRKAKIIVTIALMLGMSLAALDTTIVGTALRSYTSNNLSVSTIIPHLVSICEKD
jgi:hypothetical protein